MGSERIQKSDKETTNKELQIFKYQIQIYSSPLLIYGFALPFQSPIVNRGPKISHGKFQKQTILKF